MKVFMPCAPFHHEGRKGDEKRVYAVSVSRPATIGGKALKLSYGGVQIRIAIADNRPLNEVDIDERGALRDEAFEPQRVAKQAPSARVAANLNRSFHGWDSARVCQIAQLRNSTVQRSTRRLRASVWLNMRRFGRLPACAGHDLTQPVQRCEHVLVLLRPSSLQRLADRRLIKPRPVVDVAHRYLQVPVLKTKRTGNGEVSKTFVSFIQNGDDNG